jgi:glycosyltransferase involved in cell wall biosynthesis
VALITRSLSTGGAEQQILQICRTVSPTEVAIHLYLLVRDEPNQLLPSLPPHVPLRVSPFPRHHPRVLPWLARALRQDRIQVAHSFLIAADATAALTRRLFGGPPLIISERGDRSFAAYRGLRHAFDRLLTFPTSQWACANSAFGQRLLIRLGYRPDRLSCIPNGVSIPALDAVAPLELPRVRGWPTGSAVIGTVCRLVDYKGVDAFISALAQLNQARPVYGVIVGDGPHKAELEQLAVRLGVAERLVFLGHYAPAVAAVKDWNVAVLATRTAEHSSNSLLEYMACSRAVVATNVGGNPELITPGTGLLVPPDDAAALAQAIGELLDNPERQASLGRCGRSRVEGAFALSVTAERFAGLWQTIAAHA